MLKRTLAATDKKNRYHTDYSSSRKEMIKRDMAFSSSEEQIREILAAEIADNIKKGWEEI